MEQLPGTAYAEKGDYKLQQPQISQEQRQQGDKSTTKELARRATPQPELSRSQ